MVDEDDLDRLNYQSLPLPQTAHRSASAHERTRMSKRAISGLTVVITGAGRGIGEATAELLSARGATVALGDLDTALVQGVAERIGNGAVGAHLDLQLSLVPHGIVRAGGHVRVTPWQASDEPCRRPAR